MTFCDTCTHDPGHRLSWADARFGCADPVTGRRRTRFGIKIARSLAIDMEYRDDLARSTRDPDAIVTGPTSLRKLMDKRKREGWTFKRVDQVADDYLAEPTIEDEGPTLRDMLEENLAKERRGELEP